VGSQQVEESYVANHTWRGICGMITHNNFPICPFKEFGNSTSSLTRLQWPQHVHEAHRGNPHFFGIWCKGVHFKKTLMTLFMASSFLKTQLMLLGSIITNLVLGPNEIFPSSWTLSTTSFIHNLLPFLKHTKWASNESYLKWTYQRTQWTYE